MPNWYVSSASWSAVPAWAASTAYTVGQFVRQAATPTVGNERVFRVTTAGTSGTTEPTWTLTKNGTTTDGTVTWTECTGQEAYQAPGTWRPFARLASVTSSFAASGDTIYVGSAHAETQASAISISPNTNNAIYCVDETATGAVPPTSANLRTTATVTTTGTSNITVSGSIPEIYGITFNVGTGTGAANFIHSNGFLTFGKLTNCAINLVATGSGNITLNNSVSAQLTVLENTKLSFSAAGQTIVGAPHVVWRNTLSALGGTLPSTLFLTGTYALNVYAEGVDLSAMGSGKTLVNTNTSSSGRIVLKNCLLGSGVSITNGGGAPGSTWVDIVNCDSGAGYYRNERYRSQGTLTTDITVARTGGAADGPTAISHKVVTGSSNFWPIPFEGFPVAIYNSTTGSTVTATVCGIANAAALPNNDEFWLQVSYLGSATSPIATINNATKANALATGTALTADTSAWDANVAARANSTAYTAGQTIKTASNAGRVFFCTAAGTSAASEPAGYASAVDGGSVTDGTATFRAGVRFKQSVALSSPTPQAAGVITVTPKVAKASTTYYVDPLVTLS